MLGGVGVGSGRGVSVRKKTITTLRNGGIMRSQGEGFRKKGQKNPRVRKIFVRNSGAENGCTNFMGTWKNALFLQEKPMSIKFLLLAVFFASKLAIFPLKSSVLGA